jgi:hypothetical protein
MSFEIRDPVYGDIVLSEEEARLIDTYEMQRLRHIRQLGNVNLVFPSANHTRFEHSLGTRWLAQKIVRISNLPIKKSDEILLYKCALLHDIAEPAFAHATERLDNQGLPTHEQIVNYVLDGTYKQKVIEKKEVNIKFVCDIIKKEEEQEEIRSILTADPKRIDKPFIRELVKGYIDADSLDYLRRDSFFLGLPYGNYDDRIFASFRIAKLGNEEHIAFRDSQDTLNAILSILDSRYTLRRAAYLHHAVIIADDMLLDALRLALGSQENVIDLYDIFTCGDYELLLKMKCSAAAAPLVDSLLSRNLFKRIYLLDNRAPSEAKERVKILENKVAEESDFVMKLSEKPEVNSEKIKLHFPPPSGWKDFNLILLVSDSGEVTRLGDKLPGDLSLLKEKYDSLWRFMVSGDVPTQELRNVLSDTCRDFFGYEGSFRPKKSFDEIEEIKENLSPLIDELRKQVPSSIAVLRVFLDNDKPMSRDEIAKELKLKPSTVSHYLTLINEKLSGGREPLLLATRSGRLKLWRIDKRLREVLFNA